MTKYFINFFHGLIIAGFILSFSGCGYKADPVYVPSKSSVEESNQKVQE
ncbi:MULTISPECIES: hypothetical protein [Arcobacter]|nr:MULTISPECIES: hypothetical protein [Arcobacter]MCB9097699.1 hypothetical protein [Arcobacter sp.]